MIRLPGQDFALRVTHAAGALVRRRSPHGVILLYHRVAAPRFDPALLDVSPARFEAQLAALSAEGVVLPLDEFEALRLEGRLPPRATAITFDDGYADNLHTAAPILERAGLPATVFVTTGMIGSTAEFWWDDLERVISSTRMSGPLPFAGIAWDDDDGLAGADPSWNLFSAAAPNARQRLYILLQGALHRAGAARRMRALHALRTWAGVPAGARESHRTMTEGEIQALAARPGISIGAHTVTHACLAALRWQEQVDEMEQSRVALERLLGRRVQALAYPFGTGDEVSRETARAAQAAGYTHAYANVPGVAWRFSPRYQIPRMLVRDWTAEEFIARMRRWWNDEI